MIKINSKQEYHRIIQLCAIETHMKEKIKSFSYTHKQKHMHYTWSYYCSKIQDERRNCKREIHTSGVSRTQILGGLISRTARGTLVQKGFSLRVFSNQRRTPSVIIWDSKKTNFTPGGIPWTAFLGSHFVHDVHTSPALTLCPHKTERRPASPNADRNQASRDT